MTRIFSIGDDSSFNDNKGLSPETRRP